jgi:hypothetical protein
MLIDRALHLLGAIQLLRERIKNRLLRGRRLRVLSRGAGGEADCRQNKPPTHDHAHMNLIGRYDQVASVQSPKVDSHSEFTMVRLALLLLLPAAGLSPAFAAVEMDTAAQIYEAAGVREQVRASLGAMPTRIRDMFQAESKATLTPPQIKAITDAAERGFRIDVFEPAAISTLASNLDAPAARKILAFLQSDLGNRMVSADKALAALDEPTIDKIMDGQLKTPSSPKRDQLIEKLEGAARSTESTVQIFTSMGRAVAIGTAIGTGADPIAVEEKARKAGEANRGDLEINMREPLRRYMAYGYRDLSDADLKSLLSFLESKTGVRYVSAYTAAMGSGFDAMGKRCGEQLGGTLREMAQAQAQAQSAPQAQPEPPAPVEPGKPVQPNK